jgi:hypothetical protein
MTVLLEKKAIVRQEMISATKRRNAQLRDYFVNDITPAVAGVMVVQE